MIILKKDDNPLHKTISLYAEVTTDREFIPWMPLGWGYRDRSLGHTRNRNRFHYTGHVFHRWAGIYLGFEPKSLSILAHEKWPLDKHRNLRNAWLNKIYVVLTNDLTCPDKTRPRFEQAELNRAKNILACMFSDGAIPDHISELRS